MLAAKLTTLLTVWISCAAASELVVYWGQNSAGNEKSLGEYCQSAPGDIYVVSFVNLFGNNKLGLNLANHCGNTFDGSSLLNCPDVGKDIKACQAAGKKVLLSLGGASGDYGFNGDADGAATAQLLWDTFGNGHAQQRPFGDAVVDGFDLDIENGNEQGYVGFTKALRQQYSQDSSKTYYISAAPQCPFPDASVGDVLNRGDIDFAFIQFFNNYCSTTGSQFNWDTWQNFASSTSPNKNIKLFLGVPGSSSAAGSGYATPDEVEAVVNKIKSTANFGGIMVWDASQANSNIIDGTSFASHLASILGESGSGSGPSPSVVTSEAPTSSGGYVYKAPDASVTSAGASSPAGNGPWTSTVEVVHTVIYCTTTETSTLTALPVANKAAEVTTSAAPAAAADGAVAGGSCSGGTACIDNGYATCDNGKWVVLGCAAGTTCLVNNDGAFCGWPKRADHHIHARDVPVVQL